MRGLAAFSVALYHLHGRGAKANSPRGILAVDFFFLLSGFVLASAYQKKLAGGWSFRAFMRVRLLRLYPLYALGLILGIFAVARFGFLKHLSASEWWSRILLAVFILPALSSIANGSWAAFIFNSPSWSLFMEVLANIFHALFLRRSRVAVRAVVVVSMAALLWVAWHFGGIWVGAASDNILYGVPRVMFSYPLGILLYGFWERHVSRFEVSAWVPVLGLLSLLQVPGLGRADPWFDVLTVTVAFPILLLAGASAKVTGSYLATALALGQASYALYVLDEPLMLFWAPVMNRLGWHGVTIGSLWGFPCIATVCLVAWLADRFYDGPVREFLQRKLVQERRTPRVEA